MFIYIIYLSLQRPVHMAQLICYFATVRIPGVGARDHELVYIIYV